MSKTIQRQIFVVTGDRNQMLICRYHKGLNLRTTARLTGRLVERNQCKNYSKKQTNENKTEGTDGKQITSLGGGILNLVWNVRGCVWGKIWVKSASKRFHTEFMLESGQCTVFYRPQPHMCTHTHTNINFPSQTLEQLVTDVQPTMSWERRTFPVIL